jgi:hypothetical protein
MCINLQTVRYSANEGLSNTFSSTPMYMYCALWAESIGLVGVSLTGLLACWHGTLKDGTPSRVRPGGRRHGDLHHRPSPWRRARDALNRSASSAEAARSRTPARLYSCDILRERVSADFADVAPGFQSMERAPCSGARASDLALIQA